VIEELLEHRQILFQIAEELYGELWIGEEAFWGSPTEQQLQGVHERLFNLGWSEDITPKQFETAKEIAKILGLELPPED
jgi:hypothetical protein